MIFRIVFLLLNMVCFILCKLRERMIKLTPYYPSFTGFGVRMLYRFAGSEACFTSWKSEIAAREPGLDLNLSYGNDTILVRNTI